MPQCACCASLTLTELYTNRQEHGRCYIIEPHDTGLFSCIFPQATYFRHHKSWEALEKSARDGCALCSVIYDEFMNFDDNREQIEERLAKRLPTDIRICVDTFKRQDKGSSLLDAFIVQVGHSNAVSLFDLLDHEEFVPRVAFQLNRPRNASKSICELNMGRPKLDPDLGSEQIVNIARSWLHQCASEHVPSAPGCPQPICENYETTKLPTRILDIGPNAKTVVKLFITNNHYDYYVALSHCWGGGSCLMLMQENFNRFTQAIPMEAAPRNFRDAATIARSLGFRYLWVDSLCIVQDSYSDWDIEGSKMSDVYKNATLTISASASANTTMGILNSYIPACSTSLEHCIRLQLDEGEVSEIYLSRRVPMEESVDHFMALPLSKRAWALQEQILSQRNLYYGKRAIYWTCRSSRQSADGALVGAFWSEGILSNPMPELFTVSNKHKTPDERTLYFQWLGIVRSYSNRDLTYGSDKLPAISALAREVHRLSGGRYLAGIWLADLFNGMLWASTTPEDRPYTDYRGPSWSWVGLDTEINFLTRDFERVPSSHDAEVVHIEAIPAGQNEFGAVQSGLARLKGLTLEIDQSRHHYYFSYQSKKSDFGKYLWRDKGQSPNFVFLGSDVDGWTNYHPGRRPKKLEPLDIPDDESSIEVQQCLALYLGIWAQYEERASDFIDLTSIGSQELKCAHIAYALLLRPSISSNEQSYERIGVLSLDIFDSPLFNWNNWNTWQTRVVTII